MWMEFLNALKALIAKLEADLQAAETEFILIWQKSFPAAEQAAINSLIPMTTTIMQDLQNQGGLTDKQIASEALAQLETALVGAGKTFIMTFALQAVSTVQAQLMGNNPASTVSNGGNVNAGS